MNDQMTEKKIKLDPSFFVAKRPRINMAYGAGMFIEQLVDILYRLYEDDPGAYTFIAKNNGDT
jgi:hypothetical protein